MKRPLISYNPFIIAPIIDRKSKKLLITKKLISYMDKPSTLVEHSTEIHKLPIDRRKYLHPVSSTFHRVLPYPEQHDPEEYKSRVFVCWCGSTLKNASGKRTHIKTKKHLRFMHDLLPLCKDVNGLIIQYLHG
jgi:hypothetical protein